MPRAKIARKQIKTVTFSRREKAVALLGRMVGVKIEKTTPVQPSFVFEPEPQVRYPVYDYINLFEVSTTSWPLRRAFRAIIQECIRNRWTMKPAFKWKCDKCGKTYDHTPKESQLKEGEKPKCETIGCGGDLRPPSEVQARTLEQLMKKPNRDYHFDDFVKSSIFYDLSLDDWYWGIAFKRQPKKDGDGKIIIQNKKVIFEKVPYEIYVEDARFIFPVADEFGHLGGYEWFCSECYDKQPGDQPVVAIRQDMSLADRQKAIICPLCGEIMEQTAYVQEIGGNVVARFAKDELIHGSSSRVAPALFGNSKIVSVWKIVQTILAMDDYNWEVYSTGKVGSIIGFPGEDQLEVDEKKTAIETELKALDSKDIQSGRFRSSKKVRTLMLGLKKGQQPIRIPIMEDLKALQSLEFYKLYLEATSGVYGVTAEFVSTTDVAGGTRLKIDVQNRTTQEHQAGFTDLFNDDLLPKFGITDWVFAFNPIEGRDELRDAQTEHTRAASAMTWATAGFEVSLGPDRELIVTGKANIPQAQDTSRAGQAPRSMAGKPEFWEGGEPTRTGGEIFQLRKPSEQAVRLPISWYSMSQIRIFDRVYALNNDKDEVYVMVNMKEVAETRTSTVNINYAVANLLDVALDYVEEKLDGKKGFNGKDFKAGRKKIVLGFRRSFDPDLLIDLSTYLDNIGQETLAEKFDNLRMRLEQVKPKSIEVPEPISSTLSGEMLEALEGPGLEQKSLVQARAPFGVVWEEDSITKSFKSIIKWAKDEVQGGANKEKTIHEAVIKAKQTLDASYEELVKRAMEHARRRTRKTAVLTPEELRRLSAYKDNSLNDFDRILRDSLKGTKKNDGESTE